MKHQSMLASLMTSRLTSRNQGKIAYPGRDTCDCTACVQARGLVPEQEVRRFWEERYCAGLMRLVVVGPQPLPRELEALVCARFGAVRNLGAAVPAFSSAPPHSLDVARARKYPQACMFQSCSVRRRCGDALGGGPCAARGPRAPRPQAGHPVECAPRAECLAHGPLRPAEPPAGVRGQQVMRKLVLAG